MYKIGLSFILCIVFSCFAWSQDSTDLMKIPKIPYNSLKPNLPNVSKKAFTVSSLKWTDDASITNTNANSIFMQNFRANAAVKVFGLPLLVELSTIHNADGIRNDKRVWYSIQFDALEQAKNYQDKIKKQADGLLSEKLFKSEMIQNMAMDKLEQEYQKELKKQGSEIGGIKDTLQKIAALEQQLKNPNLAQQVSSQQIQLDRYKNYKDSIPGVKYDSLQQSISSYEQKTKEYQALMQKDYIRKAKEKYDGYKTEIASKTDSLNVDDASVKRYMNKYLTKNPFERFLSGIEQFKIGNQSLQQGRFTANNMLVNGAVLSFKEPVYVKAVASFPFKTDGAVLQYLLNSRGNIPVKTYGLVLGRGALTEDYIHLSAFHFSDSLRNNLVVAVSTAKKIKKKHTLFAEIARSSLSIKTENGVQQKLEENIYSTSNILENTAIQLKLTGTLGKDVKYSIAAEQVGNNFVSLGNFINNAGSLADGFISAKLSKRIDVSHRSMFKYLKNSIAVQHSYTTQNDIRIKLFKKNTLTLRGIYTVNNRKTVSENQSTDLVNYRLSADDQWIFKIKKAQGLLFLSAQYMDMKNTYNSNRYNTSNWLGIINQNITIGKHGMNLMATHQIQQSDFLNANTTNVQLGYTYQITKGFGIQESIQEEIVNGKIASISGLSGIKYSVGNFWTGSINARYKNTYGGVQSLLGVGNTLYGECRMAFDVLNYIAKNKKLDAKNVDKLQKNDSYQIKPSSYQKQL